MKRSGFVLAKNLSDSIQKLSKEMVQTLLDKKHPYLYQETAELFYKYRQKKNYNSNKKIEEKDNELYQDIHLNSNSYLLYSKSNDQEVHNQKDDKKVKEDKSSSNISLHHIKSYHQVSKFSNKTITEKGSNNSLSDISLVEKNITEKYKNSTNQCPLDTSDLIIDSEMDIQSSNQKHAVSIYEKSKMLCKRKLDKLQNIRNKIIEKEIKTCRDKPQMNMKSKEIIEKKYKDCLPLYKRAKQLQSQHKINMLIQEQLISQKELHEISGLYKNNKSIKDNYNKNDIDSFANDQIEWKESILFKNKIKEVFQNIKKENEIEELFKQNSELNIKNKSTNSTYIRLYLDYEQRKNKQLQKEKETKPSFNPTVNNYKAISNNKITKKSVPIYNIVNSFFNKRNNNYDKNSSNKSDNNTRKNKWNKFDPNRTSVIYKNNNQYITNFQFEADCGSFREYDYKHYNNNRSGVNSNDAKTTKNCDKTQKDPSWYNELELVSSAPSSNEYVKYHYDNQGDNNSIESSSIREKLYKLNIANSCSNGMHTQQIIINPKGLNSIFKHT